MAYDGATGQLIMFGGSQVPFGAFNDTWQWTGSNWVQLQPGTSPSTRSDAYMAYDPASRQLVLFGGFQQANGSPSGTFVNDTWTWNGSTWTQQHPATSPPATADGGIAYDPVIGKLVLFGGENDGDATWAWNGTTWSQLQLSVSPSNRFDDNLALDPATNEVILAGGNLDQGAALLADTWALDQGWTQLHPTTSAPGVSSAGLATDPGSGHLVLFGGFNGSGETNGTWIFGPLTVTNQPLPGAATGLAYHESLQATGGTGRLSWRVSSGALPSGLALSSAGTLSGTPTTPGTDTFTVTVTDSASPTQSASRTLKLAVSAGPVPGVYVTNRGNSTIHGFALGQSGNVAPELTLGGPASTLNGPDGLVFDQLGRMYVANSNLDTVDIFAPGASGNVAPSAVLGGSQTDISDPSGLTFDATGDLYVADRPANTITVYSAATLAACLQLGQGLTCNPAPVRTISGANTQLDNPQAMTLDGAGNLWVANQSSNQLTQYPSNANGNVPAIGAATAGIDGPQGLTFDSPGDPVSACGYLLSANTFSQSITIAPPCSVASTSQIAGANTQLDFPDGIDVDAAGRIYVANEFAGLNVYAPGATGNTAPSAIIAGNATGLASPQAVAVTPPLYVRTRKLPHARVGVRYRVRLRALLGQRPLRWRIAHGHLPRGLHLTRSGRIKGRPRRAGTFRVVVAVKDSTHPPMRAHKRLTLTVLRINV